MTWELFGAQNEKNGVYTVVGEAFFVRLYGQKPKPIRLTEDPDGDYMGWLPNKKEESNPQFVQHKRIFNISFPYGYQEEEKAGRGKAIYLRIEEL